MKNQERVQHTPTPEIVSAFLRNLAVNTEDDSNLKGRLHELADAVYSWHRAVNSHEALLDAAKWLLATAPNDCYDIGYQEARQAIAKAIAQAGKPTDTEIYDAQMGGF